MPGTPEPGRNALLQRIMDLERQVKALSTQQQQVISDPTHATGDPAHGYATVVLGYLTPITGLSGYGAAKYSGGVWSRL